MPTAYELEMLAIAIYTDYVRERMTCQHFCLAWHQTSVDERLKWRKTAMKMLAENHE